MHHWGSLIEGSNRVRLAHHKWGLINTTVVGSHRRFQNYGVNKELRYPNPKYKIVYSKLKGIPKVFTFNLHGCYKSLATRRIPVLYLENHIVIDLALPIIDGLVLQILLFGALLSSLLCVEDTYECRKLIQANSLQRDIHNLRIKSKLCIKSNTL